MAPRSNDRLHREPGYAIFSREGGGLVSRARECGGPSSISPETPVTDSEYRDLVDFLGRQFTTVDQRLAAMDRRFAAMEELAAQRHREVLGHFDTVYRRLETLEHEHQAIVQGIRRIEAHLTDERGRRSAGPRP